MATDQPLERGDACFILLDEVGGPSVFIQAASFVLLDPDADQIARNVVALRQTVKRLAAEKFLRHMALELDADRYALTSLPAVSSLRALRCLLAPARGRHAGCRGNARTGAMAAGPVPGKHLMFAGVGAPLLVGKPPALARGKSRAAPPATQDSFSGVLANVEFLRSLIYLDGSKAELEKLGAAFPPQMAIVWTGADARESAVRTSSEIAGATYVVFSTHGLLASQSSVAGEPGLVFTPPQLATEADDGLLTASEAAQLRLSADLVVLSACNTAASNGEPTAEGLSGLARSFLFAGARSLLVSHWEVSDESTPPLMLELFRTPTGAEADRAVRLQAAMRRVRSNPNWTSPGFWAAFTLIGIGD